MSAIARVEIVRVDLAPKVVRTDAIQAFVTQVSTCTASGYGKISLAVVPKAAKKG